MGLRFSGPETEMVENLSLEKFEEKMKEIEDPEAYCKLFILTEILAVLSDIEVLLGQRNMRDIYK